MTPPSAAERDALIDELARSGRRIGAAADALAADGLREPSALPGWTRADVLTHLARAADAYRRLITLARTGAEPQHPRVGAVDADDADPVADFRGSLAAFLEDARRMPAPAWDATVTALAGWPHPAWFTLYRCRRELETHHTDLATGHTTADWPADYVAWALDDTLAALAARDFPLRAVHAVDLDRRWTLAATGPAVAAPAHLLLGWLSGRSPAAVLTTDRPGELLAPPAWPLPPVRSWT
ncbi:maleylpyruvate isomerase family mycothiol-dependent enzyme [Kitasatospora cinereorecta]|uniref:Maleylpyruvate isomerase family mycothiol-dependent enzyme n=1 Tax=Kitasatospora cinereorecta TaxID=285560 RepID=A0ABW0VKT0_9ACTN